MVSDSMRWNRFELLFWLVQFANNDENDNDRLNKINSDKQKLVCNFQSLQIICIDESLLPFYSRLEMRQYIKNKRYRYDIQVFKLCSETGIQFESLRWKKYSVQKITRSNVVLSLYEPILNFDKTLSLITVNWYTSLQLQLAEQLLHQKRNSTDNNPKENWKGEKCRLLKTPMEYI